MFNKNERQDQEPNCSDPQWRSQANFSLNLTFDERFAEDLIADDS